MAEKHTFRFANPVLNEQLLELLNKADVKYSLQSHGGVAYLAKDEDVVENEILQTIRNGIFSSWQLLSCPTGWSDRYKAYMIKHQVPFEQEWTDEQPVFVIPRQYRPHSWRLPEPEVARTSPARIRAAV